MTAHARKVAPANLMGATEVATYLGVSRQRVLELRQKNPAFPEPVQQLKSGPVWDRTEIDSFLDSWERKPGRPRKDTGPQKPQDSAATAASPDNPEEAAYLDQGPDEAPEEPVVELPSQPTSDQREEDDRFTMSVFAESSENN
jgi:predicted DNA-binding transcriptional regulator AlpA